MVESPVDGAEKRALVEFLQRKMSEVGWNQADLARAANISRAIVSTYMNGLALPSPTSLEKISNAFGYPSVNDLRAEIVGAVDDLNRPEDLAIAQRKIRAATVEEAIILLQMLSDRVCTLLSELESAQAEQSQTQSKARKQHRKS